MNESKKETDDKTNKAVPGKVSTLTIGGKPFIVPEIEKTKKLKRRKPNPP